MTLTPYIEDSKVYIMLYGPQCEKTCLRGFLNNKGADQAAHPYSLISPCVIRFLESIISKLAASEISLFYSYSLCQQTGFSMT